MGYMQWPGCVQGSRNEGITWESEVLKSRGVKVYPDVFEEGNVPEEGREAGYM